MYADPILGYKKETAICLYAQNVVTYIMNFVWDEKKNQLNIEKHGISFDTAIKIFEGPVLTSTDNRKDYKEVRKISLGKVDDQLLLTVVSTDRNECLRIISARIASQKERRLFENAKGKNARRTKEDDG